MKGHFAPGSENIIIFLLNNTYSLSTGLTILILCNCDVLQNKLSYCWKLDHLLWNRFSLWYITDVSFVNSSASLLLT